MVCASATARNWGVDPPVVRRAISSKSRSLGNGTRTLKKNRSSCASGSGYVPSSSMGFWVARTKNGDGNGRVCVPTVTVRSCIASSSALCVLGVARLISPAGLVADDVGAHDVGWHQVRCELDARKAHRQRLTKGTNQDGLSQPGHALEQDVSVGDQGDDGVSDQRLLSNDETGKLGLEGLGQFGHFGGVDARFFGDHDPPWRVTLFG